MIQKVVPSLAYLLLGGLVSTCQMNTHLFNNSRSTDSTTGDGNEERNTETASGRVETDSVETGEPTDDSDLVETDPEEKETGETDIATDSDRASETEREEDAIIEAMGIGAGIANTLENTTSWETGWGLPAITQAFIGGMAQNGIKTVRLPVAWDTYAVDGVIQSEKIARVREVVDWIVAAGMYCIVNIHWDGGWIHGEDTEYEFQLTDEVQSRFESYWQQIAGAFSDVGDRLLFESLNVERFYVGGDSTGNRDYAALKTLNQLFVNTVRAAGGANSSRYLLISGFGADIDETCVEDFGMPSDAAGEGKMLLSIHFYTPYTFTQMEEPAEDSDGAWTYPATTWGTSEEDAAIEAELGKLAAFSAARDFRVVISELAVTIGGNGEYIRESDSRVRWMTRVMEIVLSHGMVPLLWDGGTDINRTDGTFSAEFAEVMSAVRQ